VIGFRFVDDHQAEHSVTDLCRVAGVSRSGYYAWRSRPLSTRAVADAELLEVIREIHWNSRGTYGAPRIRGQLRRAGHRASRHRVARLMRTDGLVGAHGRRKWRRGRHPAMVPAPDLLQRDFSAERSDLRWVADISEFGCCDGKLYLAGIRDLHDHTLVGWSMGERQTTDLVVAALVMALGRRNPTGELTHHADHGTQGGINRSSQHLDLEVFSGPSTAGSRSSDPSEVALAWSSEVPAPCRGGLLGADRPGGVARGGVGGGRYRSGRWRAMVPQRWRHAAIRHQQSILGPLPVLRRT
jgi:hypothetical protein